jgi:hypothetical protein
MRRGLYSRPNEMGQQRIRKSKNLGREKKEIEMNRGTIERGK